MRLLPCDALHGLTTIAMADGDDSVVSDLVDVAGREGDRHEMCMACRGDDSMGCGGLSERV